LKYYFYGIINLTYNIRHWALFRVLIMEVLFFFFLVLPPCSYQSHPHFPKSIRSTWTKSSVMIVCLYDRLFYTFLDLDGIGPPLHLSDPVNLYSTKIFILNAPVTNKSYIYKICCDNRRCLYFFQLIPNQTEVIICKETACQLLKPRFLVLMVL